eukprot:gnl/Spiro4/22264_TR10959_c0_g1_i1.p1 gnl/Spiro4/22264_TR10959_c0_g1~~gnl/Spiro4/22264_TR10959_c0_g1_i1.p1  ORF type:complete len:556 (-),score=151.55 gnl/Spiro4/22264_TR10959_c0_g1_i1:198-1826(-)
MENIVQTQTSSTSKPTSTFNNLASLLSSPASKHKLERMMRKHTEKATLNGSLNSSLNNSTDSPRSERSFSAFSETSLADSSMNRSRLKSENKGVDRLRSKLTNLLNPSSSRDTITDITNFDGKSQCSVSSTRTKIDQSKGAGLAASRSEQPVPVFPPPVKKEPLSEEELLKRDFVQLVQGLRPGRLPPTDSRPPAGELLLREKFRLLMVKFFPMSANADPERTIVSNLDTEAKLKELAAEHERQIAQIRSECEARIQAAEQEASSLRSKLNSMDSENESLKRQLHERKSKSDSVEVAKLNAELYKSKKLNQKIARELTEVRRAHGGCAELEQRLQTSQKESAAFQKELEALTRLQQQQKSQKPHAQPQKQQQQQQQRASVVDSPLPQLKQELLAVAPPECVMSLFETRPHEVPHEVLASSPRYDECQAPRPADGSSMEEAYDMIAKLRLTDVKMLNRTDNRAGTLSFSDLLELSNKRINEISNMVLRTQPNRSEHVTELILELADLRAHVNEYGGALLKSTIYRSLNVEREAGGIYTKTILP